MHTWDFCYCVLVSFGIDKVKLCTDLTGALDIAVSKPIFYPLIGYYVDQKIDISKVKTRHIVYLVLAAAAGIIISCICTYYEGTHGDMTFTQHYVQLFDYLTAITAFVVIKYFFIGNEHRSWYRKTSGILALIGGLTLGMYLIDPIWEKLFYNSFKELAGIRDSAMLASLLWCFVSMAASAFVTWFLKKIPAVAKVL